MGNDLRNIKPLTALRAFLAFWVLTRHWFFLYPEAPTPFFDLGFPTPLFDKGYLGVDGFFILSGFILAYTYGQRTGAFDYRDFVVNRIARIYPVHIVCLALAACRIAAKQIVMHQQIIGTPGNSWVDLAANVFLVSSWLPWQENGWNDVAWSVSAEWFAYLAFPLFMVASKLKTAAHTTLAMLLAFACLIWLESTSDDLHLSVSHGLGRLIPEFYLGALIYRLRIQAPWLSSARYASVAGLALIALAMAVNADTLAVMGLALLVTGLASERDVLAGAMSIRPLIYLGEISYCIYLVQRVPQNFWALARLKIPAVATMPIGLSILTLVALCVLSAVVLHHAVENPARRVIKRWLGRADLTRAPATELT